MSLMIGLHGGPQGAPVSLSTCGLLVLSEARLRHHSITQGRTRARCETEASYAQESLGDAWCPWLRTVQHT